MERIIDRLDKFMKSSNLNDNQVTVQCNLSIGLLGKARQGKSDLGKKAIDKILSIYQNLNRTWLLTGDGEMFIKSDFSGNEVNGNGNVLGNNNNVHHCDVVNKLTDQNSRLLSIIEEQMEVIKNLSSR